MKFKRKSKTIYKMNEGERYIFRNGIAKVPGVRWKGKPMTITLNEFKELSRDIANT